MSLAEAMKPARVSAPSQSLSFEHSAVHSAVALAAQGRRVAALDLDTRQRTLGRYLDNRTATIGRLGVELVRDAVVIGFNILVVIGLVESNVSVRVDVVAVPHPRPWNRRAPQHPPQARADAAREALLPPFEFRETMRQV